MQVKDRSKKYRTQPSNYDKFPFIEVSQDSDDCQVGWHSIRDALARKIDSIKKKRIVVVLETYHGVLVDELISQLALFNPTHIEDARKSFKNERAINALQATDLGDHPIFGYMADFEMTDFIDLVRQKEHRSQISQIEGLIFIVGPGASLMQPEFDVLIYADMARWEIQQRMRSNRVANLGDHNHNDPISQKYKRAYFIDWRVCDRLKRTLFDRLDYLLDTNDPHQPKMISGEIFRTALAKCVAQPFRVVPFFDPGVWGGQWMREVCHLSDAPPNYAWCFDCVPEENSLLLGFGDHRVEIPALNLVFLHPVQLLGHEIYRRFGAEFPIRFDFLDTMAGGNLSLQVHPLKKYMKEHFGLPYTQDESYYFLDVESDAVVYLGQKENIDPSAMIKDLELAQDKGVGFPAEKYIEKWSVKKHDHILIPAGTVHCSGRNSMVLEISATPYIFTFKLWDWGRVDLDGNPRPISIEHGKQVIQWDRSRSWVEKELINQIEFIAVGEGWREERTGLHKSEFIETRRHWFTKQVPHHTQGNLNVLNLVEGEEVVVESPDHRFAPFVVHYAETFIVPAQVGAYTIRPMVETTSEYSTIKAYVRPEV